MKKKNTLYHHHHHHHHHHHLDHHDHDHEKESWHIFETYKFFCRCNCKSKINICDFHSFLLFKLPCKHVLQLLFPWKIQWCLQFYTQLAILQALVSLYRKQLAVFCSNVSIFLRISQIWCVTQTIDSVLCRKNSGQAASVIELITITLCRTIAIKLI